MSRFNLAAIFLAVGLYATPAGLPVAPVPADPHELVGGGAVIASTPAQRATVLALFERAKQNADLHIPGTPPFSLTATFKTSGSSSVPGPGELREIWMSSQAWRWTASLGEYSQVRYGSFGTLADASPVTMIPMRVQSLRAAIFWPVRQASNAMLRTANVHWNGRPVTCILNSQTGEPSIQYRQWVEEEHCIDTETGLLQIHSPAPGSFIVYGYSKNMQFHGRVVPDHITTYIAGTAVIDAQVDITDAGAVAESELKPTAAMLDSTTAPIVLQVAPRRPLTVPGPAGSDTILPVIVHVIIGTNGKAVDEEVAAAADPSLAQSAIDVVRSMNFDESHSQRETYINVRFTPPPLQR